MGHQGLPVVDFAPVSQLLPVRPQLFPLCRRGPGAPRLAAGSVPESAAPAALPSFSPRGLGPGALGVTHGKKGFDRPWFKFFGLHRLHVHRGEDPSPPAPARPAGPTGPAGSTGLPAGPGSGEARGEPAGGQACRGCHPAGQGRRGGDLAVSGGIHRSGRPLEELPVEEIPGEPAFHPHLQFQIGAGGFRGGELP